jgi:hypothetical protein
MRALGVKLPRAVPSGRLTRGAHANEQARQVAGVVLWVANGLRAQGLFRRFHVRVHSMVEDNAALIALVFACGR